MPNNDPNEFAASSSRKAFLLFIFLYDAFASNSTCQNVPHILQSKHNVVIASSGMKKKTENSMAMKFQILQCNTCTYKSVV